MVGGGGGENTVLWQVGWWGGGCRGEGTWNTFLWKVGCRLGGGGGTWNTVLWKVGCSLGWVGGGDTWNTVLWNVGWGCAHKPCVCVFPQTHELYWPSRCLCVCVCVCACVCMVCVCMVCVQVLFPLLENVKKFSSSASTTRDERATGNILIHHTRDTAEKQWAETRVLSLAGVARTFNSKRRVLQHLGQWVGSHPGQWVGSHLGQWVGSHPGQWVGSHLGQWVG